MKVASRVSRTGRSISDEDARIALDALVESDTFSGSERLIGFLAYVVNEVLDGRGDVIRAKSIALDVYHYEPDEIERRESVVRVDAGRVRRKLQKYYEEEGKVDPVQIDLPKGGYVPVFRSLPKGHSQKAPESSSGGAIRNYIALGTVFLVVIAFAVWQYQARPQDSVAGADADKTRRAVLFDTSPQRLEAVNLAQKGRELIFPAFDPGRLTAAMLIFEAAINLDATYEGGYAGAAQLFGLHSILATDRAKAQSNLASAFEYAEKALDLSPTSAWALSARAWAEFSSGNHEASLSWSGKAMQLAPSDPHVLEFDALISLYSGEFERVFEGTEPTPSQADDNRGFVFQNARGAAYFHKQDYEKSIASFEDAVETGAPMGPVTVAYLMAANHYLGREERAKALAGKYVDTWPNQRVDLLFLRLFKDEQFGDQLAQGMRLAGWAPE